MKHMENESSFLPPHAARENINIAPRGRKAGGTYSGRNGNHSKESTVYGGFSCAG